MAGTGNLDRKAWLSTPAGTMHRAMGYTEADDVVASKAEAERAKTFITDWEFAYGRKLDAAEALAAVRSGADGKHPADRPGLTGTTYEVRDMIRSVNPVVRILITPETVNDGHGGWDGSVRTTPIRTGRTRGRGVRRRWSSGARPRIRSR